MRLRLILSFSLIVLVAVFSVVLIARQGAASAVRTFMFRGGMYRLDTLVNSLERYYRAHRSWEGVEALLVTLPEHAEAQQRGAGGRGMGPGMMAEMMGQRLRLADDGRRVIADTASDQPQGSLSEAEVSQAIILKSGLKTIGYLLPENTLNFTLGDESLLVTRLTRAALLAGGIAGVVSLPLAIYLAFLLLRPVQELTHVARSLAAGNLAQRVVVAGDDEMALLGQTFNRMVDSLQKAEESRRAMIADIAHELRTPLAVQQANLEALQDGIYPLTAENLVPLLEQNQLLIRLVEDLRVLALADTGQLTLESTEIDLGALLQSVAARFYPKASINQATIETLIQPDCPPIKLDPARIEQILTNLLSNALRHTPAQGKIEINMAHSATQAVVTVRDTGAGIPPEALPHIFERFYRAEKSRSRIAGGSGLGLSIARQLAQLHGGDLTAANHPQGGAVFTLTLPISNDKK